MSGLVPSAAFVWRLAFGQTPHQGSLHPGAGRQAMRASFRLAPRGPQRMPACRRPSRGGQGNGEKWNCSKIAQAMIRLVRVVDAVSAVLAWSSCFDDNMRTRICAQGSIPAGKPNRHPAHDLPLGAQKSTIRVESARLEPTTAPARHVRCPLRPPDRSGFMPGRNADDRRLRRGRALRVARKSDAGGVGDLLPRAEPAADRFGTTSETTPNPIRARSNRWPHPGADRLLAYR